MITSILKGFLGAIIGLLVSLGFLFLAGDSIFNAVLNPGGGATDNGAAAYIVMQVFAGAGLIIGAILIYLPWHINRWLVLLLLILFGVNLYINRYLYIERPPQVESLGNFELLTYELTTVPVYGLRYAGKPIAIEEQAGFMGDERATYTRFDTLITLTVPATITTTITAPVFIITVGDQYHDFFYLVREVAGQAKLERLGDNTTVAADWLDVTPSNPTGSNPTGKRNRAYGRSNMTGGRWLLLGDNCVLDVQTLTAYPIDMVAFQDSANALLLPDQVPLAFSPDQQSFARLAERNTGEFAGDGVPRTAAMLAVFNFVERTSYLVPVVRAQMRYNRIAGIDSAWLDDYFVWQKSKQGIDQLAPRPDVTPLPYHGDLVVDEIYHSADYILGPAKRAMLETMIAFLEQEFKAVATREKQFMPTLHSVKLQIGQQSLSLDYDEDSSPPGELRLRLDMDNESQLLETIAQHFDAVLKTGVHDELFLGDGEKP